MLGSEWTGVVVPFQIFAIGMLFRTSYKMSDSISRATGAVYRRAWRQGIYALLVIGGAYYGQRWGLAGVAWGVLGAIFINFLLMAELSLMLAKMKWRSFIAAHRASIFLTITLGPETWWIAKTLRELSYSPVALLVNSIALVLLTFLLLARLMPRVALGKDGIWMSQMMLAYLPGNKKPQQ
jgi:PST family polysaccharide transporter